MSDLFRSVPGMLDWAKRHPGRLAHPNVRNFLGVTFLKQALYELTADAAVLQQPATDENFAAVTAPLWAWYDAAAAAAVARGPGVSRERTGRGDSC